MGKSFSEINMLASYDFKGDNKVLVDVGAHVGSVTMKFAKKGWKVIAFEPEDMNASDFEDNLRDYQNVTLIKKAVTDKDGELISFYISEKHYGIHSIKPFHETHEMAYKVETCSLEKELRRCNIEQITLLKIDTEGADFLALKGMDWSYYHPKIVMIEFMDERSMKNFNYDHHDVVNYMKSFGYLCYVSEWEPISQYGIKGGGSGGHNWIRITKYPLNSEPAWGNLIFVSEEIKSKFRLHLIKYPIKQKVKGYLNKAKGIIKVFLSQ